MSEKGCEDICKEAYSCAIDHLEELPDNISNSFDFLNGMRSTTNFPYVDPADHNGEMNFDRYELPTLEAGHDLIIDVSIEHNDSQNTPTIDLFSDSYFKGYVANNTVNDKYTTMTEYGENLHYIIYLEGVDRHTKPQSNCRDISF